MNLRKIIREKKKERADAIKNTYVIQTVPKLSHYRSKPRRNRMVDLENYKPERHAASTETMGRNTKPYTTYNVKHDLSESNESSPPAKIKKNSKLLLSPPKSNPSAPTITSVQTPMRTDPLSIKTVAHKALRDMNAIEYYWYHKNLRDGQSQVSSAHTPQNEPTNHGNFPTFSELFKLFRLCDFKYLKYRQTPS